MCKTALERDGAIGMASVIVILISYAALLLFDEPMKALA
jgi:hypothetical protein